MLSILVAGACLCGIFAAPALGQPAAPGAGFVPAKKALYADGNGARHLLDGDWLYRADPADQGLAQGFHTQVDSTGWSTVQVPNVFNADEFDVPSYLGRVGWYRKDFTPPAGGKGVSWVFRFESVNHRATVYLNGRQIGRHVGPYIPFEVPAEGISETGVNRLVVRVDSRRNASDVPAGGLLGNGGVRGGWWNYGGINREVYLRRVERVDITDVYARPRLRCRGCEATIEVSATLRNPGRSKQKVRFSGAVAGRRLSFSKDAISLNGGGSQRVSRTVTIRKPRLWEPGRPNLYKLSLAATRSGKKVATYGAHVGVRSLQVDGSGRVLLNGRKVSLRGASVHEDVPVRGNALSTADIDTNVALLRELGADVTRAHYPLHPRTLELADRAGILVWEQIPFWRIPTRSLASGSVRGKGVDYLRQAIRRDRNHASVFVWSVGNELPSKVTPGQRRYLTEASAAAREEDPSRLVGIDFTGHPSLPPESIYRRFDVLGANSYYGWYHGPNGQTADISLIGPYLEQLHDYYPEQGLFVTEFGAEANRDGPAFEKGTHRFQQSYLRGSLGAFARKPFLNGAIMWILRDFQVRPNWDGGNPRPEPPTNFKGVVTRGGAKKPAFGDAAAAFNAVPSLR